ncbi:MAG: hypothetical protein WCF68_06200 [Terriglobales bacterium]
MSTASGSFPAGAAGAVASDDSAGAAATSGIAEPDASSSEEPTKIGAAVTGLELSGVGPALASFIGATAGCFALGASVGIDGDGGDGIAIAVGAGTGTGVGPEDMVVEVVVGVKMENMETLGS